MLNIKQSIARSSWGKSEPPLGDHNRPLTHRHRGTNERTRTERHEAAPCEVVLRLPVPPRRGGGSSPLRVVTCPQNGYYSSNIISHIFWREKIGKKQGKGGTFRKRKTTKKNQAEIRRFTSTIQMVLNSPLSWTLIAVQKKGKLRELGP